LDIPATLTKIDEATFRNTSNLVNIDLKGGNSFEIDGGILFEKGRGKLLFVRRNWSGPFIIPASVKIVGAYALEGCAGVTEIGFARGCVVTALEAGAFAGTSITNFEVPSTVARLGDGFVQNCRSLVSVTFAASTNCYAIPRFAFEQTALVDFEVPAHISGIEERAFSKLRSLKKVRFAPNSKCATIEEDAFWSTTIESLEIPNSVAKIGRSNFFGCQVLETISITRGHPHYEFEWGALWKRGKTELLFVKRTLDDFQVPSTVELIGGSAFFQGHLKTVGFAPDARLREIGSFAFYETALTAVAIPDTVTRIGESAFANCFSLCDVRFGSGSQLGELGWRAFGLTGLAHFQAPKHLECLGGALFANSKLESAVFPEAVTSVPPFTFFGCKGLAHVVCENGGTVTAASHAFEEANASLVIHKRNPEQFIGAGPLKVTPSDAREILLRASERYERAPLVPRSLADITVSDQDREPIEAWGFREGGYARVYKARHVDTLEVSAVKVLKRPENSEDRERAMILFTREIEAMKSMVHPAILGLIGVVFPAEDHAGKIVTEFMVNDSLDSLLRNKDYAKVSPTVKVKIAVGIATAVRFMHEHGLVHRDLKPHNVLLDENFEPRVADFGSARAGAWDGSMTITAQIGTPYYMAPELWDPEPNYGPDIDVFSYAITLWELVTGKRMREVFPAQSTYQYQEAVRNKGQRPPLTDVKEGWVSKMLALCWSNAPAQRMSFQEILEEFRKNHYKLVPGVNEKEVDEYLKRIQEFERQHPYTS
jgi:tRNA A-37 threonylcarbamoyl transferase component Bud32